jgi:hypothetical protein
MTTTDRRRRILQAHGAAGGVVDELLHYTEPLTPPDTRPHLPLADEPHLDAWTGYARQALGDGTIAALTAHLVQLRFPVRAGISQEHGYRAATRTGDVSAAATAGPGLVLKDPASVRLEICETIAGRIPVLIAGEREDFVSLVQALTERNEPVAVPGSIGACIVSGLNNWHRVAQHRERWMTEHPGAGDRGWLDEWPRFAQRKTLYQDRLIILSSGPYSGLSSSEAGVTASLWLEQSLAIRLAHECTHYFTLRAFGRMRSHVLDELVADFVGLIQGIGRYSEEMGRRVLGLQHNGSGGGGRIENYCGSLSVEAKTVVGALATTATTNLGTLSRSLGPLQDQVPLLASVTYALSLLSLEDLASPDLLDLMRAELP